MSDNIKYRIMLRISFPGLLQTFWILIRRTSTLTRRERRSEAQRLWGVTGGRSGEATNWPGLQNSGLKGQLHLRLRGGEDQRQGGQGQPTWMTESTVTAATVLGSSMGPSLGFQYVQGERRTSSIIIGRLELLRVRAQKPGH